MRLRWLMVWVFALGTALQAAADDPAPKVIKHGSKVAIDYTLRLSDGTVADTSGDEPLVYEQGASQVLPALEQSLAGLSVGDEKKLTVPPEQGYGPIREDLYQTIPIDQLPPESRKPGAVLIARDPQGKKHQARVREVRETEAVLDLNHPLAGKALVFEIKVVSID